MICCVVLLMKYIFSSNNGALTKVDKNIYTCVCVRVYLNLNQFPIKAEK